MRRITNLIWEVYEIVKGGVIKVGKGYFCHVALHVMCTSFHNNLNGRLQAVNMLLKSFRDSNDTQNDSP